MTISHACSPMRLLALMLISLGLAYGPAQADYPEKPIRVIVPFGPGGATDFQARIVTMLAAEEEFVGQPMVIVNKPGAGGQRGWNEYFSDTTPDGYTITAYNLPHILIQSIARDTKYNREMIEPLAGWGADPAVLVVAKDSQFKTVQDVIDFAKENPSKLTISGGGLYGGHHIAALQFDKAADIKTVFVPSKSGGVEALNMVMGGRVLAGFNNMADAYRSQHSVRILAVAADERVSNFIPDVPTFRELGIDVDDTSTNVRGMATIKGTPDSVIAHLSERIHKMFQHPRVAKRMEQSGSPMKILTRDEVIKQMRRQQAVLEELFAELKGN